MRIVSPAGGGDALACLVAEMRCLEAGARGWGPEGPLPPPHAPWPLVALPAGRGPPVAVHYRPVLGVVFCAPGVAARLIPELRERLGGALPTRDLAAAATSGAVVRGVHAVREGTAVVPGDRLHIAEGEELKEGTLLFSRAFAVAEGRRPPHYSRWAAFTWAFCPLGAAVEGEGAPAGNSKAQINMELAGLVYDPEDRFAALPRDVASLPLGAFRARVDTAPFARVRGGGALVVWPGGRLSFAGPRRTGRAPRGGRPPPLRELPLAPAGAARGLPAECLACGALAGGEVAVLRLGGNPAVVCEFCWVAGLSGRGFEGAARLGLPGQAEAAEAAGEPGFARVLGARGGRIPGAPGAALLSWPDGGRLVCVAAGEGFPELDLAPVAALAAEGVPVLLGVGLALAR